MEESMSAVQDGKLGEGDDVELRQVDEPLSVPYDKYQVEVERLMEFLFPKESQHPLVAGRLFAFGICGPLNENGQLPSGMGGKRVVMSYELDEMCMQFEREDILQIYLQNPRLMGLLSTKEQEAIIAQADGHLKREKGKAMLPRLTKEQIYELFEDLPRNAQGRVSFHDMQTAILDFRLERIKQYKLVYPSIGGKKKPKEGEDGLPNIGALTSMLQSTSLKRSNLTGKKKPARKAHVSDIVACPTMFQKNKGLTNSDIVQTTTKYLSKFAYKISDIDNPAGSSATSNVRLLRDIEPRCKDPYQGNRTAWEDRSLFKGSSVGSHVKCTPSATTYKQKITFY